MSQERKCGKCGGEMREGELFINVTSSSGSPIIRQDSFSFPTGSIPNASTEVIGEGPFWRERTGEKKGWLIKREETQILNISGLRCTNCGYIELYALK